MKQNSPKAQLRPTLHGLSRSMDFVSRQPSLNRDTAESRRLAEIYQQLGLAWEFLALQCRHREGWRELRDGHFVSELPRKRLKNFPVMLQFDKRRRFTGLVVFKPNPEPQFANRKERKDRKEGNSRVSTSQVNAFGR